MAEYVGKGQGNYNTVAGSIGLGGAALGVLGALTGGMNRSGEDRYITRYDADMMHQLEDKDRHIALLEADKYTDQKILDLNNAINARFDGVNMRFAGVEQQIGAQAVYNATNTGTIACLQGQIAQLQSLTKLVIPNSSVDPGWGAVKVTPVTSAASTTVSA